MKKLLSILLVLLAMFMIVACTTDTAPTDPDTTDPETPDTDDDNTGETTDESYNVTVIIKATDSNYWQTVLMGAEAAANESNGKISVTTAGPTSETDIDEQVSILENAISTQPDGIVIASISSDSTVPAVEDAVNNGIPVVTVDNKLNTDVYTQHLATDHYEAASSAAEAMVAKWEEKGIDPAGKKVVVLSADSGSAVNQARTDGFLDKIQELVPDIEVLSTQYADNDIGKAQDMLDNLIIANEDLIGVFGDNNHMGNGIANSIEQNGKAGEIISYAFDSDDTEIAAIKNGVLTGIVVQDPYGMGYDGVLAVIDAVEGNDVTKDVVAQTTLVTQENIEDPEVQALLYPGQ